MGSIKTITIVNILVLLMIAPLLTCSMGIYLRDSGGVRCCRFDFVCGFLPVLAYSRRITEYAH